MDKRIWKPLAMTLAVSAASVSYAHADVDIDNDGLIEISTLQELDLMRYDLAGTSLNGDSTGCPSTGCNGYELVADLDFDTNGNGIADTGDLFWNGGAGWEPIGALQNSFEAIFNGNNHTLKNLYIDAPASNDVGLFGVAKNATLKNIVAIDAWVRGEESSGVLAGTAAFSSISYCRVTGYVASEVYASGGGVGSLLYSEMRDCEVSGDIEVGDGFSFFGAVGGMAGYVTESSISRGSFIGTVVLPSNKRFAGGLVGLSNEYGSISDSFAYADVSGGFGVGGILGYAMGVGSSVERSYAVGSVTGSPAYSVGGVVGYANNPVVTTSSYWDSDVNGITTASNGEGKTTSELKCPTMPGDVMCDASLYADWDETIWDFGTSSDYPTLIRDIDGDGIYDSVDVDIDNDGLIEISTLQQLDLMRHDLAGTSLNGDSTGCPATGCNGYELVADLDFDTNGNGVADAGDLFWNGGAGWEPIGALQNSFEAIFNGNNHTLANLYINRSNLSYVGLFSVIKNAFVEKMNLSNTWISGEQSSGSLVGTAVFSTISTCQVVGSVRSDVYAAGGIAGSMVNSSMSNCDVTGEVKVLNGFSFFGAAGGLVGDISDSTIAKSNFSGTVLIPTDKRFAGGLVGLSNESGSISDSFAYADVSGGFGVGGILGYAMGVGSSVEWSYAVGSVTGSPAYSVGGVVGYANNPVVITSSYWDSDVNGITTASNGEGKTTFELQCPTMPEDVTCDASMYSGWDDTIWDFGTSSDYPVLR